MGFNELLAENQRLAMLKLLQEDTGAYTLNESMLHDCMGLLGIKCSRDVIRTQLAWLQEQGLITLDETLGFYVATLTSRGFDVAVGNSSAPGVKRPRPRG
ncbi:MAG: ArsR family transcriptional regulator [Desulfuromonadaceae bacterium]|nr:ArsR family transcriptional regulator [Desulfuromonadaceae bacterium]